MLKARMGRARTLCWLVLLCGCSDRIQTGEDWPDAGAPRPDGNAGAAGQGGAPGTGGTSSGGSGGTTTGATAGTGGVGTGGAGGATAGTGGGTGGVDSGAAGTGGSRGGSGGTSGGADSGTVDVCVPGPKPACPVANAWIPSAACGAAACGNGVIDSCTNECGQTAIEMCDGSALGAPTCQDLGYAGGTLKCSTRCGWDTSGCTRCSATNDVLRACLDAPVAASVPTAIAMDATDQEIALAWTSLDTAGDLRLHFARFAPDLTLISERGPFGPSCAGAIALASRPGGWSLAVTAGEKLQVLTLDATGATTGEYSVPSYPTNANTKMVLAHRDGTGPLLVWDDARHTGDPAFVGYGTKILLDADGRLPEGAPQWWPPNLELNGPTLEGLAAIPTPVGWLVASDHQSVDDPNLTEVEVVELTYDGRLVRDAPRAGFRNGKPRMAAEGRDFRMSFVAAEPPGAAYVVTLTYNGQTGNGTALGPGYENYAPLVLINGATSVFTAFGTGHSPRALHYLQYDANLQPVGAPRVIATDADAIKTYVAARRGPDAIVAWINGAPPAPSVPGIGPSSIGLARVTPPTM